MDCAKAVVVRKSLGLTAVRVRVPLRAQMDSVSFCICRDLRNPLFLRLTSVADRIISILYMRFADNRMTEVSFFSTYFALFTCHIHTYSLHIFPIQIGKNVYILEKPNSFANFASVFNVNALSLQRETPHYSISQCQTSITPQSQSLPSSSM